MHYEWRERHTGSRSINKSPMPSKQPKAKSSAEGFVPSIKGKTTYK